MDLRIFTEPQQGASYDTLLTVAKAAEDLGFDAFFRSDHYLKMGEVTGEPGPTDAWITLAGLARDTRRIKLGTLVSPATFRLPGPLAISVAQVDAMAGPGRVELGLGTGWFEDEHTAYGIPFPEKRFGLLEEQLEIITGLWNTPDGATYTFKGEHYAVSESPALPKPATKPHPPIILGGGGPKRTPRLAARYASEFNTSFRPFDDSDKLFTTVREAVSANGRSPESMTYSAALVACVGRDEAEFAKRAAAIGREPAELRENGLAGTPGEVVEKIGRYAGIGAQRLYLQFLDLQDLDHMELIASDVMRQL
ncbi:Luciferase-like monooxygenase [Catenulispora acidiphila DSM 44928]|uniref:Luciferase-like monooxygenase n=1 Tax=Catenulispora acidiphila (strain DSM 44928 / JCM 14897 / NBRC 102108 / NRRL B-24433 / ID139908) TaxID=479433 RepID=C7QF51_CATAD|nr:LLM class F420-dependent oxidoreductase [Catenulispora acidiphila]ACU74809.1 Luciferase-like monooxygenase [Catenulispora acidiphila DSM 44928]